MKSLQLANAEQNYNLLTLMRALDPRVPSNVEAIQIQFDVDGGGARLRIGNGDLSDTNFGVLLFASQAFTLEPGSGANALPLGDIFLRCDTASLYVSVTMKLI